MFVLYTMLPSSAEKIHFMHQIQGKKNTIVPFCEISDNSAICELESLTIVRKYYFKGK